MAAAAIRVADASSDVTGIRVAEEVADVIQAAEGDSDAMQAGKVVADAIRAVDKAGDVIQAVEGGSDAMQAGYMAAEETKEVADMIRAAEGLSMVLHLYMLA